MDKIQKALSKNDAKHLIEQAKELEAFQKSQEEINLNILPKLTLSDVPVHIRNYPLTKETIGNFQVFHHNCFTNEIIYADLVFNLPDLSEDDLIYARLFTVLLPQMGCGGRDYIKNLEFIQANTGGIHSFLSLNIQVQDYNKISPSISLKGKALHRKVPMLFQLLYEMSTSVDFSDVGRLREVLQKHYTGLESSLNQNSLRYAINLSTMGLSLPSHINNLWNGLEYFWKIKTLAQNFDEQKNHLINKMLEMKDKLLCLETPDLVLSCDAKTYDELKGHHFYGLLNMELKPNKPWQHSLKSSHVYSQGRIISAPVAFIGKAFPTVSYVHEYTPALNIAAFLFDNLTLHSAIREQGGAYGGGAVNNAMSGHFYFYSYRDPNIVSSLEAFGKSIEDILKGEFDDEDLSEAKLEMIQAMDAPVSPGSRADLAYSWLREGKTPEIRQTFRNKLLGLTREEVIKATELKIASKWQQGATVVFAGKELLEKENAVLAAAQKPTLKIEPI